MNPTKHQKNTSVVAVIPAYNESGTIGDIIEKTEEYVDDVVVVDDGSTDMTSTIAQDHGATVISHAINTGVGGAVRTGYLYAIRNDYDFIVQIDADGQHDPSYIPELLEIAKNYDMVIGSRYLNDSYKDYSLTRNVGIQFFTTVVNVLGGLDITDVTSGFRIYRVDRLEEILHHSDSHWAVEQTLSAAKQGLETTEISVEMPTRDEGESQFTLDTFALYPIRMADVLLRILIFR